MTNKTEKPFTPTEWEIIEHRLACPDAIAQALTDGDDECPATLTEYTEDFVEKWATALWNNPQHIDLNDDLDRAIIIDCLEGSTFFCDMTDAVALGEISKGKYLAYCKASRSLEKRFKVEIPTS